ncbi:MAG: RNA 2',3'-cyclic phosphodiesterase [Ktedonobacterales bacterium]|nr:RNA 2',3'-cyclic phosphodiesterase [Ktedonobacterales bacterium]
MPMTRTFLAIEVDAPTRTFMAARVATLRSLLPSVRFVAADTWHLTLAFLGDLDEAQVQAACASAAAVAHATAPFVVRVAGLGTFGDATAPRVIWLGVAGMLAELRACQERVGTALDRAGLGHDGRFSPHLTLARLRQPLPPTEAAALQEAQTQASVGPDFTVTHIAVMRSDLTPSGARYSALARAPLAGA